MTSVTPLGWSGEALLPMLLQASSWDGSPENHLDQANTLATRDTLPILLVLSEWPGHHMVH